MQKLQNVDEIEYRLILRGLKFNERRGRGLIG